MDLCGRVSAARRPLSADEGFKIKLRARVDAALDFLSYRPGLLDAKVRLVNVGTHSAKIEVELCQLLSDSAGSASTMCNSARSSGFAGRQRTKVIPIMVR
jgi:hypothetical protein